MESANRLLPTGDGAQAAPARPTVEPEWRSVFQDPVAPEPVLGHQDRPIEKGTHSWVDLRRSSFPHLCGVIVRHDLVNPAHTDASFQHASTEVPVSRLIQQP